MLPNLAFILSGVKSFKLNANPSMEGIPTGNANPSMEGIPTGNANSSMEGIPTGNDQHVEFQRRSNLILKIKA